MRVDLPGEEGEEIIMHQKPETGDKIHDASTEPGTGNRAGAAPEVTRPWATVVCEAGTEPVMGDRLASPAERWGGFGTCGWTGAGRTKSVQPLVAADAMPARVHAVYVRDYDRLRRARFTTLAALQTFFGPRADSDSRPQGPSSNPPCT